MLRRRETEAARQESEPERIIPTRAARSPLLLAAGIASFVGFIGLARCELLLSAYHARPLCGQGGFDSLLQERDR